MYYGIGLPDVAEKLVAQAFALARSFHETGNVYYLDRSRYYTSRMNYLRKFVEPFVGHGYHTHVGLYGAEWKVGRLCLSAAQAIEKSGLAYVRKPDYTAL